MPATQACTYVHNPSQAHIDILPVACGRVNDLLEEEHEVSVSSMAVFSSRSSIFTDKHSILTLYINRNFRVASVVCATFFFACVNLYWYVIVGFCRGMYSRQCQLLLEGTGPLF